jgi:hypothetical protein
MALRNIVTAFRRGLQNNLPYDQMKTLNVSEVAGKRFKIRNPDGTKWIYFGQYPLTYGTYIDHWDDATREAWFARHSRIAIQRDGKTLQAINYPNSPDYYAARILW